MEFVTLRADGPALIRDDGNAVTQGAVIEALVAAIKWHSHYGNLFHHIAKGDWEALAAAMRQVLFDRCTHDGISILAQHLARTLGGSGPPNISSFRQWLLDNLETESSSLHRGLVERRIDALNEEIRRTPPVLRKSASRILGNL